VLAGPKVARLLPYLQEKGFIAEGFVKGSDALNRMRQAPCHLLLIELECTDTMGIDLARGARQEGICGATLLVDDPMKSGMIISALARGVDAYVAIPPDETTFFSRIETMLLAQWGLVVTEQQNQLTAEIARLQGAVAAAEASKATAEASKAAAERRAKEHAADLDKQLAAEKKKVAELEKEAGVLRDQLATMHLVTGAKSGLSDEGRVDWAEPSDGALPRPAPAKAPLVKPSSTSKGPAAPVKEAARAASSQAAAKAQKPAPQPIDEDVFGPLAEADDRGSGEVDETTADIPINAVVAAAAKARATPTKAPVSVGSLDDFDPIVASGGADKKTVSDANTASMSADLAKSLLAEASQADARPRHRGAPTAATPIGSLSVDTDDEPMTLSDFDAPPFPKGGAERAPASIDSFFDEPTPAGGVKGSPMPRSISVPPPKQGTFDRRPGRPPALDSQVVKDVAKMPSLPSEEVLFLEDE
jgi:DNA-binding response OmpR family regulator